MKQVAFSLQKYKGHESQEKTEEPGQTDNLMSRHDSELDRSIGKT